MLDMGADILQIQSRAVDIPRMKALYGDKIGFNVQIDAVPPGASAEERRRAVRDTVDRYGAHGGVYTSVFAANPEEQWADMAELYCYSREFYDREAGR
jgi:hypothetical protein